MNVGELIRKLQALDPEMRVVVDNDDYGDFVEAEDAVVISQGDGEVAYVTRNPPGKEVR